VAARSRRCGDWLRRRGRQRSQCRSCAHHRKEQEVQRQGGRRGGTRARAAFHAPESSDIDSSTVRTVAFPLVKRGYQVAAVDAALGRPHAAEAAPLGTRETVEDLLRQLARLADPRAGAGAPASWRRGRR
jgi:DivIVA domain-containing protein